MSPDPRVKYDCAVSGMLDAALANIKSLQERGFTVTRIILTPSAPKDVWSMQIEWTEPGGE